MRGHKGAIHVRTAASAAERRLGLFSRQREAADADRNGVPERGRAGGRVMVLVIDDEKAREAYLSRCFSATWDSDVLGRLPDGRAGIDLFAVLMRTLSSPRAPRHDVCPAQAAKRCSKQLGDAFDLARASSCRAGTTRWEATRRFYGQGAPPAFLQKFYSAGDLARKVSAALEWRGGDSGPNNGAGALSGRALPARTTCRRLCRRKPAPPGSSTVGGAWGGGGEGRATREGSQSRRCGKK